MASFRPSAFKHTKRWYGTFMMTDSPYLRHDDSCIGYHDTLDVIIFRSANLHYDNARKLLGLNSICLKIYDYPFEHIYKLWFRGIAFISYPFHCKYNMKYFKSTYHFSKRNLPMTPLCFHNFKHEAIIGLRENLFGLLGLAQNYFPIQMCDLLCKKKVFRIGPKWRRILVCLTTKTTRSCEWKVAYIYFWTPMWNFSWPNVFPVLCRYTKIWYPRSPRPQKWWLLV